MEGIFKEKKKKVIQLISFCLFFTDISNNGKFHKRYTHKRARRKENIPNTTFASKKENKVSISLKRTCITSFLLGHTVKILFISMELPKCNFKGNLAYVGGGQEAQE